MKAFKARARKTPTGTASHFVTIDDEAEGRVKFHFVRILHNLDDYKGFPIPRLKAATFKEQLRSLNRAYAVTVAAEKDYEKFIELMLKETYGDEWEIEIFPIDQE